VIDLHCHILPGIDDGAATLDDAVAMAGQAHEDGIHTVCATPHIRHDHDVRIEELAGRVAELNAELERRGLPTRVAAAGELAETMLDSLDGDELLAVSYGQAGGWVLLEPAPGPIGEPFVRAVERLHARGTRAVIAHPERHLSDDLVAHLRECVERGALVQVTADLLNHPGSRDGLLYLARHGLVHLLGSDSHSHVHGRPVALSGGFAVLGRVERVKEHLEWMALEAPAAILAGEPVEVPFRAG
jgi:protein-tyrosine phosphatase